MEINEDYSMRIGSGYLYRASSSKRVSHHPLCLSETQRQAAECHNFTVEKGSSRVLWLAGGCCHGEAGDGFPLTAGIPLVRGVYLAISDWS